jgi:impB/mucB/samB family
MSRLQPTKHQPARPDPASARSAPAVPEPGRESLFAAVSLPDPPAQALVMAVPGLRGKAFAVIEKREANAAWVLAASPEAAAQGVSAGMTFAELRGRHPQVTPHARDLKAEADLWHMVRGQLERHSPDVEASPRRILADLTGTPLVWRSAKMRASGAMAHTAKARIGAPSAIDPRQQLALPLPPNAIAWVPRSAFTSGHSPHSLYSLHQADAPRARHLWHDIAERLQTEMLALGLNRIAVGLGRTRLIAQALAASLGSTGALACPPADEHLIFGALHPRCLPNLSRAARDLIRKFQWTRVEHIAAFTCAEIVQRFGAEGEALHRMACGHDLEAATPRRRDVRVEMPFPETDVDDERLRQVARFAVFRLCMALRDLHAAADRVAVCLVYRDGRQVTRTIPLRAATAAFPEMRAPVLDTFGQLHQRRVGLSRITLRVTAPRLEDAQMRLEL